MENATEALKMAFAVLVFVVALTITFSFIAKAKTTADSVFSYTDRDNLRLTKTAKEDELGQKEVDIGTVISTIYRCKTEKLAVTVVDDDSTTYTFNIDTYKSKDDKTAMDQLKEDIVAFVSTHVDSTDTYLESFTEATYSGNYQTADDGTELIMTSGSSKIYITYTKK